jgi:hypothetical protein
MKNAGVVAQRLAQRIAQVSVYRKPDTRDQRREERGAPSVFVPLGLWLSFVEMQTKIRRPLTEQGGELIRKKLRRFRDEGFDPVAILEESIANSWAGVFKPKGENAHGESFNEKRSRRSAEAIENVLGRFEETPGGISEHYRQPVNELSVMAYAEDLAKLTPEQLDRACLEARRTSEFMPVSAAILKCHEQIERRAANDRSAFLGVPQPTYPKVSQEEREAALEYSTALRKALGISPSSVIVPTQKRAVIPVQSPLNIQDQKEILRRKGYL